MTMHKSSSDPSFSLCLISEGYETGFLRLILPQILEIVKRHSGELIIAGSFSDIAIPEGLVNVAGAEEAKARKRGKLRNLSISNSKARTIISTDLSVLLGPENWPKNLLEWVQPIASNVSYLFGFEVVSAQGNRSWDWISVDSLNKVTLAEYGEQFPDLALGAGCFGMSRSAWEISAGFNENLVGLGEDIEFSQRCLKKFRIPIVFCDAFYGIKIIEKS